MILIAGTLCCHLMSSTAGTKDSQGRSVIKFGPLFMAYQVRSLIHSPIPTNAGQHRHAFTNVHIHLLYYGMSQDISDTLVGIMMRAKKRRKIQYVGDMLWKSK